MVRFRIAAVCLILGLALLPGPAGAVAPPLDAQHSQSISGDAFFLSTSGCVQTWVGIYPVLGIAQPPGDPATISSSLNMQLQRIDTCTNTTLLDGAAGPVSLPTGAFQMQSSLTKGSLHATVNVVDTVSGATIPVTIDIVYDGQRGVNNCTYSWDKGYVSFWCTVTATGTVTDGTTNFTPEPGYAVPQLQKTPI
jgi:hypothetical protein